MAFPVTTLNKQHKKEMKFSSRKKITREIALNQAGSWILQKNTNKTLHIKFYLIHKKKIYSNPYLFQKANNNYYNI